MTLGSVSRSMRMQIEAMLSESVVREWSLDLVTVPPQTLEEELTTCTPMPAERHLRLVTTTPSRPGEEDTITNFSTPPMSTSSPELSEPTVTPRPETSSSSSSSSSSLKRSREESATTRVRFPWLSDAQFREVCEIQRVYPTVRSQDERDAYLQNLRCPMRLFTRVRFELNRMVTLSRLPKTREEWNVIDAEYRRLEEEEEERRRRREKRRETMRRRNLELTYRQIRLENLNQAAFLPRSLRLRFEDEDEAEEMMRAKKRADDDDDAVGEEEEEEERVDMSIGIAARRKALMKSTVVDLADDDEDEDDDDEDGVWYLGETVMSSKDGLPKIFNRQGIARRDVFPDEAKLDRVSFYPEWVLRSDTVRYKTSSASAAHTFCMRTRGNEASVKSWARRAALEYLERRVADYDNPEGKIPEDLELEIVERGFNCNSCLERHFVAIRFSDCDAHYFCKQCGVLGRDVLGKDACFCCTSRCRPLMKKSVSV